MIDMLKNSHELWGKGQKLDVMDVIYNEIWSTVIDRRAPIFGPYLMRLIRNKWWHATKEDITLPALAKDLLPNPKWMNQPGHNC